MGLGIVGGIIAFIIVVIIYIYAALAYMALAKKIGTPNGWLAFIPVANTYLMSQMAGMPWWPMLLMIGFFIPFFQVFFIIAFLVFSLIWAWKIFEKVGRPGWWVLIALVPFVGGIIELVLLGIAA